MKPTPLLLILLLLITHPAIATPQPRIVGGVEANPETRNFMAHINLSPGMCGGVMLRKDWVVTAAHCVDEGLTPKDITVTPGSLDLATQTGKEWIPVKRILIHQNYNTTHKHNDIALLQLEYPSRVGVPIPLVDNATLSDMITSGATAWAFGRGVTSPLQPGEPPPSTAAGSSSRLLQVELPLVARDVCEDMIARTNAEGADPSAKTLTQGQLCAGGESGKGVCNGDSGGPLLVQKNDGYLYLAGIASWVQGCAQPNFPAIFTRVPSYINDLVAIIREGSATLNGEPDITAVLPPKDDTGSEPETDTGGGAGDGTNTAGDEGSNQSQGSGGGALSLACLTLPLLRRRKK